MRRAASLVAAGLLALSITGCGTQPEAVTDEVQAVATDLEDDWMALPEIPADVSGGKPWVDSCVVGNVTADTETSPTEDFYLFVNKDWIVSTRIPEGQQTTDNDVFAEGRSRVAAALAGDDLGGHDARQAQLLFRAFCDTDARDALGCAPARQVIDDIRSLGSIDEVFAFLLDTERSAGVPTLVTLVNARDWDTHRWETRVRLSDATFGATMGTFGMDAATVDPASDVYRLRLDVVRSVLTRAGYTEDEARAAFEGRIELEKELLEVAGEASGEQDDSQILTIDQLDGLAGTFPLRALAEARGYGQAKEFVVSDAAGLQAAGAVLNDEHLGLLRDYLVCGYALEAGGWLDTEAFEAWRSNYDDGEGGISLTKPERNGSIEETAVNFGAEIAPTLVGRAYVEGCDLARTKEFMEDLCREAVEEHKRLVSGSEWLSDDSKRRLCEKLAAVDMKVVYPDVWEDYFDVNLEGLGFFEARRAIWLHDLAYNASLTNTEIDDRLWDKPSLIEGGAAYDTETNSFHVDAGVCEGDVARYEAGDITLSQLLGGSAGYGPFHEIGHAIDVGNIYFDAEGNGVEDSLLEPDDLEEYERRADRVREYLDGISIWEGQQVQGELCAKEAVAEILGMQARLAYAARQDGFDYRAFFEQRAQLNPTLSTPEFELGWVMGGDYHPTCYLDTNVTVQQFDEFMEAYGVGEGDGMWLAPEDRLVIW